MSLFLMLALSLMPTRPAGMFADNERARLVVYWNSPERYKVSLPSDARQKGAWQVRLTPEGSLWLWKYQNALGVGKVAPTTDFTKVAPQAAEWKQWLDKKIDSDYWKAQTAAESANLALLAPPSPATPDSATAIPVAAKPIPPDPGPIPPALLTLVGNPPSFANIVTPLQHTITFDDGETLAYKDNIKVGNPRYAYYRFPQGVVSYGASLKTMLDTELNPIFEGAGFAANELKIAKAVSILEGGFDSINTYDTGFVSVGFIQCITAADGRGSLTQVLQKEKADRPADFDKDFRQYGLDVTPDGTLTVIDPGTGAELAGKDAVMKVVEDKRLTAVFQHAGRRSLAFRIAQVQIARSVYWPANDPVNIMLNGKAFKCRVCDVVKSEAGMATLFDRKVNRGNIKPFEDLLTKIMAKYRLDSLSKVVAYEKELIQGLQYRTDFLADATLSQPFDPLMPMEKENPPAESDAQDSR